MAAVVVVSIVFFTALVVVIIVFLTDLVVFIISTHMSTFTTFRRENAADLAKRVHQHTYIHTYTHIKINIYIHI